MIPTPALAATPTLEVLASGFGSPDDVAVTPAGDILFGDFTNKAINILRPGDKPIALSTGFSEPEGIVIAKDGAIIVAEQGTNRLIEVDPSTGSKKLLRQLVNNTGKDGVDGVALDPSTGDIIVPDSPNGRILRVSRDGSKLQVIATGFVRPAGAAVEPGGSILVADEFGNQVYRLKPNGSRVSLAKMYQPDDVVVGTDGNIYANTLGGNIVRIDPATGRTQALISGLKLPHGLAVDLQGNLIIAEAGRNRIMRLVVR